MVVVVAGGDEMVRPSTDDQRLKAAGSQGVGGEREEGGRGETCGGGGGGEGQEGEVVCNLLRETAGSLEQNYNTRMVGWRSKKGVGGVGRRRGSEGGGTPGNLHLKSNSLLLLLI